MIAELPPVAIPGHRSSGQGSPDHPLRVLTRGVAGLAGGGWDPEVRADVTWMFDALAPEWHTRTSPERTAVVRDALDRGGVTGGAVAVEVGSGIGTYSPLLADRFATVAAVDLSIAMLRRSPPGPGQRIRADGADLPVRAGAADAVVLVNAFLFPREVDRVLAPGGRLVWVNISGEGTPIHLPADEVRSVLPGDWRGVASRAGQGTWCVLWRA
ncbi:MAG TPA: class I SAM-dependent methyltransferase [Acidimicrobiales bacterium]|nr:class I SAM-dependent methyltransferase [Acidimicrobiales bacterium]